MSRIIVAFMSSSPFVGVIKYVNELLSYVIQSFVYYAHLLLPPFVTGLNAFFSVHLNKNDKIMIVIIIILYLYIIYYTTSLLFSVLNERRPTYSFRHGILSMWVQVKHQKFYYLYTLSSDSYIKNKYIFVS